MPLRLEIGPKDIEKSQVVLARRDTREKSSVPMDGLAGARRRAARRDSAGAARSARCKFREEHTTRVASYDEFKSAMEGRPGFVIAGWCGSGECEAQIKAETQATMRNIPFGSENVAGHLRAVRQAVERRSLVREGVLKRSARGSRHGLA